MKDLDIIESKIYLIRGKKVMMDRDLSILVWRSYKVAQFGCSEKLRAISGRLYVSTYSSREPKLEVSN